MQRIFRTISNQIVRVFAGGEKITATFTHPFKVGSKWIPAGHLKRGMALTLLAGSTLAVDSVKAIDTTCKVYNLRVAEAHTYYVGEAGVLVHNQGCGASKKNLFALLGVNDFINYKIIINELPGDLIQSLSVMTKSDAIFFLNKFHNDPSLFNIFKTQVLPEPEFLALFINSPKNYLERWLYSGGKSQINPSLPPNPNALPSGPRAVGFANDNEIENLNAIADENAAADILAKAGYNVQQNPVVPVFTPKAPDYMIEGKIYDCYSPNVSNPRNVWSSIYEQKIKKMQTNRIVINLNHYTGGTFQAIKNQFMSYKLPGLEDLIIIDNTGIIHKITLP